MRISATKKIDKEVGKKMHVGGGRKCMWVVVGRSGVPILDQVIREGPPKWITFEQRPVGGEGASM